MSHIDHIHPVNRNGGNESGNLALCCPDCNSAKDDCVEAVDPETGLMASLYNPRQINYIDRRCSTWGKHFKMSDDGIPIGTSPTGRATERLLFRFRTSPKPQTADDLSVSDNLINANNDLRWQLSRNKFKTLFAGIKAQADRIYKDRDQQLRFIPSVALDAMRYELDLIWIEARVSRAERRDIGELLLALPRLADRYKGNLDRLSVILNWHAVVHWQAAIADFITGSEMAHRHAASATSILWRLVHFNEIPRDHNAAFDAKCRAIAIDDSQYNNESFLGRGIGRIRDANPNASSQAVTSFIDLIASRKDELTRQKYLHKSYGVLSKIAANIRGNRYCRFGLNPIIRRYYVCRIMLNDNINQQFLTKLNADILYTRAEGCRNECRTVERFLMDNRRLPGVQRVFRWRKDSELWTAWPD